MNYDWVVVGLGFTGATFAERLAAAGRRVLAIDRRAHLAGNAYDEPNGHGILCHRYGPHIFHTNSPVVRDYLSRFTAWRPYEHRVLAAVDGRLVPIPFNLTSVSLLFPPARAARIEAALVAEWGAGNDVPILRLREPANADVRDLAEFVYRGVFESYTRKQWGMGPLELNPSVTARVPVAISRDDRYFRDAFQAMPRDGYTALFRRMIDHAAIDVKLGCAWYDIAADVRGARVLYTGALDELLDYRFGPLPYRTLRFVEETLPEERHQPVAIINHPGAPGFTRICEQKHLTGQQAPVTTLVTEYPEAHRPGETTPYYPVPRDDNAALHRHYVAAVEREMPGLLFAGRLADYRYYNMDQACARALKLAQQVLPGTRAD